MKALVVIALLLLNACATCVKEIPVEYDAYGYSWRKTGIVVPVDRRSYFIVTPGRFQLRCGINAQSGECAIITRDADGQYSGRAYRTYGSPEYYRDHATKHFDGWVHISSLKW